MATQRIYCEVILDERLKLGEFANAFRVVSDGGGEVFLDFCVYSASEQIAKVVSRVRIQQNFLPLLLERLRETMVELTNSEAAQAQQKPRAAAQPTSTDPTKGLSLKNGLLVAPDGTVVLIGPRVTDET